MPTTNKKTTLILGISTAITIILLSLFLFRGTFDYGMNFDEVFRTNNIWPYINPQAENYDTSIYSINILGHKIPLMHKEYISTLTPLVFYPLKYFTNPLHGLRSLEYIFFLLSILIPFLILYKYKPKLAIIIAILTAISPLIFPDIRFKFSSIINFIPLSIGIYYAIKYAKNPQRHSFLYLFLFSFFVALSINLVFYSLWGVTAMLITSVIIFPKIIKSIISSPVKILAISIGTFLGLFNYIIYNIANGFPSLNKLYLKIFDTATYNQQPIDFKPTIPLLEEINTKLHYLSGFFIGNSFYIYVALLLISVVFYILCLYKAIKNKKLSTDKIYFFPLITFLLIFIFILISPNTTRLGHYTYLTPFLELTIILAAIFFEKLYPLGKKLKTTLLTIVILFSTHFYTSNIKINQANVTHGEGYFSPVIYQINNFFKENNIQSEHIIHTQWGHYAQLYFLNKGEFKINSVFFELLSMKDEKTQKEFIDNYLRNLENGEKYYTILYEDSFLKNSSATEINSVKLLNNLNTDVKNKILGYFNEHKIKTRAEKLFHENPNNPLIGIYSF
jgi:hypothetical protein